MPIVICAVASVVISRRLLSGLIETILGDYSNLSTNHGVADEFLRATLLTLPTSTASLPRKQTKCVILHRTLQLQPCLNRSRVLSSFYSRRSLLMMLLLQGNDFLDETFTSDPLPTSVLKLVIDAIAPFIAELFNCVFDYWSIPWSLQGCVHHFSCQEARTGRRWSWFLSTLTWQLYLNLLSDR